MSSIFLAIQHSWVDCVRRHVENGANVNAKDIEKWMPIHEAVRAGDAYIEILKYLRDEC